MARQVKPKKVFRSRKECYFTKNNIDYIDYKDVETLKKFTNDKGKIKSSKSTGTKAKRQRELATAIKRARQMGLMPFMKITTK